VCSYYRFLWRQNNPEVNYAPIRTSGVVVVVGVGWGVFLREISSSKHYSKKDYREKKKEQHSFNN
jgi:hypothetical protein